MRLTVLIAGCSRRLRESVWRKFASRPAVARSAPRAVARRGTAASLVAGVATGHRAAAGIAERPAGADTSDARRRVAESPQNFSTSCILGGRCATARRSIAGGPGLLRGRARIAGTRAWRGAQPRSPSPHASAGLPQSRPRSGPRSNPKPPVPSRSWRRSPAARQARTLRIPSPTMKSESGSRKLLSDAAVSGKAWARYSCRSTASSAQQRSADRSTSIIRSLAKPYPASPEAHFAVALCGLRRANTTRRRQSTPALIEVDRALGTEARLGARGASQGRHPCAQLRPTRPLLS